MERIIKFVLLLLTILPLTAEAQWNCGYNYEKDGIRYGVGYQYDPFSGWFYFGLIVIYIDTSINSDVIIPDSVDVDYGYGYEIEKWPVTAIALNTGIFYESEYHYYNTDLSRLTSITIPSTIRHISVGSFIRASNLNVNITDLEAWCNISYISVKNYSSPLVYYEISTGPGFAYYQLFLNGEEVTNLNYPSTFTDINAYVFSGCKSLSHVTIPNSVTAIGEGAFSGCTGLTDITIPNSVNSIGDKAFSGCTGITDFTIPNSVTTIGECAFSGCTGITDFTIPNSVNSIGCALFAGCTGLNSITVEPGNSVYDSRDNCNAIINTFDNELIAACKNTIISKTVTSIKGEDEYFDGLAYSYNGFGSFEAINMDHLVIPSAVTQIGHLAFVQSYIKKIYYNPIYCYNDIFGDPHFYRYWYPFAGCQADEFIIGGNVARDVWTLGASFSTLIMPSSVSIHYSEEDTIANIYFIGDGNSQCDISTPECQNLHIAGLASINRFYGHTVNLYCYDETPPQCTNNTFDDYSATLHVPATSLASYFSAPYWCNFANIIGDVEKPNSVTLSEEDIEIKTCKSFHLNATVDPMDLYNDSFLIWRSSNTAIATVENGEVYALSEGECDITVTYFGKQDTCHVTVVNSISLSLDKTEVTIEKNDSTTLSATILPESESGLPITWTSSNTKVAVVDNGLVTAVDEGECDITATCLGVKAVCHVIVTKPVITIMLDQQEAMVLPNHIITLTPSASPSLPELAVTSSDPTVAAVRLMSGKVQVVGVKEGTSTITVGSADGTAVPATCLVTVYTESGDANCDGFVNISDVTAIINFILNDDPLDIKLDNADYNGDGEANISDVIDLINMILNTND